MLLNSLHTDATPDELRTLGFEFAEFDFNERTGETLSVYERAVYADDLDEEPEIQRFEIHGNQPAGRHHLAWRWFDGRITVGYDDEGNAIIE